MPKIEWDASGERYYETGTNKGVLFTMTGGNFDAGVAWNGLTGVTVSPSGAEANPFYADNIKYLSLMSAEEIGGTIEAYTYPDEFSACDGTAEPVEGVYVAQQSRKRFGLTWQTIVGNDEDGNTHARKIHLLYRAMAGPSEKAYATVNESPEPIAFSWEVTTENVAVPGLQPAAYLVIDSRKVSSSDFAALEDILYGTETNEPKMPTPAEVLELFAA